MSDKARKLFAVFCDDIRQEVGEKQSWLGIYSGDMIVPQLPIVLAKLCVAINITTPAENPLRRLRLYGKMNDAVVFEQELSELVESTNKLLANGDAPVKDRYVTYHSAIVASPLQIEAPSIYQIFADTEVDGETLRSRKLRITPAPSEKQKA